MSLKHWFKVQTPPLAYYALIKLAFGSFACTWSLAEFLPHSDSGVGLSFVEDLSPILMSRLWLQKSFPKLACWKLMEGRTIMPCQCLWVSCYPGQLSNWPGDQLDFWVLGFILCAIIPLCSLPFPSLSLKSIPTSLVLSVYNPYKNYFSHIQV